MSRRRVDPNQTSMFSLFSSKEQQELPPGFERGSLPGTITPTSGTHAGVPMTPNSALVRALQKEQVWQM